MEYVLSLDDTYQYEFQALQVINAPNPDIHQFDKLQRYYPKKS